MKTMIMNPSAGWSAGQLLRVGVLALALTLTACGGGGGGTAQTVVSRIQQLVATGTAANHEAAMDLFIANMDTLSVADFEAAMDALIVGTFA